MIRNITAVFVAMFFIFGTSNANAGSYGFAQVEGKIEASGFVPTMNLLVGGSLYGSLGFEGFALVTDGWAELYAGPTYTPIPELTIGLFVGMETGFSTLPRFATEVIANYKAFSFFGVVELNENSFDGNQTGLWFKLVATGAATDWLKLGVEWRRFAGFGPHIDAKVPGTPLEFWVSWTPVEPEALDGKVVHLDRFLLGGKVNF